MGDRDNQGVNSGSAFIRNWYTIAGVTLTACSLFVVFCLIAFDLFQGFSNPYMGILTYLLMPGFIWVGLVLIGLGSWHARRMRRKPAKLATFPCIDLNNPRHRRNVVLTFVLGFLFLLASAFGSYRGHQVTESVQFCGRLCHAVMHPQYTAYQNSPHARVRCTECHIGPGATWLVRSKISGMYQMYAVVANTYPRPIPTPVENLRPSRETCEECHWPGQFTGSIEWSHRHFMPDEDNSTFTIRMLLKVGGANPIKGPVGGIHWHMIEGNRIEYIPGDNTRQSIPWVRLTNLEDGHEVVYESTANPLTPEEKKQNIRRMDCIDCHNRPTHIFASPNEALDISLWLNRIDPAIPYVKLNAANALVQSANAETQQQGLGQIADMLSKEYAKYADQTAIQKAIVETQNIFKANFFPEMKTYWKVRPRNIGHHIWPGCFRCHDGYHVSETGETISNSCDSCHTIIAQGRETVSQNLDGLKFDHPGGEIPQGELCSNCHTGAP